MISGLGFGQVAQFQSKPLFKDACIASIYFISPDISSLSVVPSFNLLPHLHSSFTSFLFIWNPTEVIRISLPSPLFLSLSLSLFLSFHPLLFLICTSVLSPIQPTPCVLIPLHTGSIVHLCFLGAARVTDSWVTDMLLLWFLFHPHSYKSACSDTNIQRPTWNTQENTADLWLVSVDCGANYTLFNRPSVEEDTYRDWWCVCVCIHLCFMGGQWNMDNRCANPAILPITFVWNTHFHAEKLHVLSNFGHARILNCVCMFLESFLYSKLAVKSSLSIVCKWINQLLLPAHLITKPVKQWS